MISLLLASLIAGLPQPDAERVCKVVTFREQVLHETDTWLKAWIWLSFNGVELRSEDKRELMQFCERYTYGAKHD